MLSRQPAFSLFARANQIISSFLRKIHAGFAVDSTSLWHGGGGKSTHTFTERTVTEPTDLYDAREGNRIGDESVFLPAGLIVTVIGECRKDDWCQVSASPNNLGGWAWGGHFK
jgi:hypothetical protein